MTQTKFKRIPFDLELAKKITNKEVKGRIVTEDGLNARIVCFDMKYGGGKTLAALVDCGSYEIGVRYDLDGTCRDNRIEDKFNLHIKVPTYHKDYSNFKSQKWQQCVVRQGDDDILGVLVYSHRSCLGEMLFYNEDGFVMPFVNALPLTEGTSRLIGTSKSYEEVIKYLDAELTKNEQQ